MRQRICGMTQTLTWLLMILLPSVARAEDNHIVIKGSKFFYANGSQFFVRGVTYRAQSVRWNSPSTWRPVVDVLANNVICEADIPLLVQLGINTIYVESVDQSAFHDACMFAFGEAGIYVVVRLDGIFTSPAEMIGSEGTNVFYDYLYTDALKASIDIFQKYSNTLGFLVRASSKPYALAYSKSMIGDLKDYIEEKGYRAIPVGALNLGLTADRLAAAEYLNCGEMHHSADFVALLFTIEEHLGCDDMIEMLQTRLVDDWRGYSVPSYIHYGCPANKSVDFTQVQVLYNNDTTKVFSGGVVHDLIANSGNSFDAGLVEVAPTVSLRQGYWALQSQIASIHPSSTEMTKYTPTNSPPSSCRDLTIVQKNGQDNQTTENVVSAIEMPKPNKRLCLCMMNSLGCVAKQDQNPNITEFDIRMGRLCPSNDAKCLGTRRNASFGIYDSYVWCTAFQQGSWKINRLYTSQGNNASVCSAYGGVTQQPTPLGSQDSDCQVLLRQAGPQGTGSVTYFPSIATMLRSSDSDKGDPLPSGSKTGIGVGVTIAFCIVIAGIVAFCIRARRKARRATKESGVEDNAYEKAELDGQGSSINQPAQLDSREISELGGLERSEMGGGGEVCELSVEVGGSPVELEAPTSIANAGRRSIVS